MFSIILAAQIIGVANKGYLCIYNRKIIIIIINRTIEKFETLLDQGEVSRLTDCF